MDDPSLRQTRLALAAALAAAILVGGGGFLLGRSTSARGPVPRAAAPVAVQTPPEVVAEPEKPSDRVMTRADIIALAAQAADALASGRSLPADFARAEGRRFKLNIPFGCQGPAAEGSDAAMRWRYDAQARVLRVHVAPVAWNPADILPDASADTVAAIKGYWIARPWSSSEACPPTGDAAVPSGADSVTLPGQTLAIAQFSGPASVRQGRGDKPFETVVRMPGTGFTGDQGLRLRVSGRIASVPGGGPVACRQPAGAEQRPLCVIAITTDEVAIEDPVSGDELATWTIDGRTAAPD